MLWFQAMDSHTAAQMSIQELWAFSQGYEYYRDAYTAPGAPFPTLVPPADQLCSALQQVARSLPAVLAALEAAKTALETHPDNAEAHIRARADFYRAMANIPNAALDDASLGNQTPAETTTRTTT